MGKLIGQFPNKSSLENTDLFLLQDSQGYKNCTKQQLLSGLTPTNLAIPWSNIKTANYTANPNERIIADTSVGTWILTLPSSLSGGEEIEILPLNSTETNNLLISNISKFENVNVSGLKLSQSFRSVKLVYINSTVGWVGNPAIFTLIYPTTTVSLNYSSNGDANGVFYYLGTNRGIGSWANPYAAGKINIFYSSLLAGQDTVQSLVDRQGSYFHTNAEVYPFIGFDLTATYKLALKYWSYRARSNSSLYIPNRLIITASNDGVNYTQIDDKSFSVGVNSWVSFPVASQTTSYRYFKFIYPANNYFTAGEFELYGDLVF